MPWNIARSRVWSKDIATCPNFNPRQALWGSSVGQRQSSDWSEKQSRKFEANRGQLHPLSGHVVLESLDRTLEQHQAANEGARIRLVPIGTDPHITRPAFIAEQQDETRIKTKNLAPAESPGFLRHKESIQRYWRGQRPISSGNTATNTSKDVLKSNYAPDGEEAVGKNNMDDEDSATKEDNVTSEDVSSAIQTGKNSVHSEDNATVEGDVANKASPFNRRELSPWVLLDSKPASERHWLIREEILAAQDPELDSTRAAHRRQMLEAMLWLPHEMPNEDTWSGTALALNALRRHLEVRTSEGFQRCRSAPKDILEYAGRPFALRDPVTPSSSFEPWAQTTTPSQEQGCQRMDAEIESFVEWLRPSDAEIDARRDITQSVLSMIRETAPIYHAQTFGSAATGLTLPTSDIDIQIFDRSDKAKTWDHYEAKRPLMIDALKNISIRMSTNEDFEVIRITEDARHPLLEVVHRPTGLKVQIVTTQNRTATHDFILSSIEEHPPLRAAYLVLKAAFDGRGLSGTHEGHISSYGVFNMLVACHRARTRIVEGIPLEGLYPRSLLNSFGMFPSLYTMCRNDQYDDYTNSPSLLLMDFLHLFAHLNNYRYGISASTGLLFEKDSNNRDNYVRIQHMNTMKFPIDPVLNGQARMTRSFNRRLDMYLLCLQDGADPYNDVGATAYGWKHMGSTIEEMWNNVRAQLDVQMLPVRDLSARALRDHYHVASFKRGAIKISGPFPRRSILQYHSFKPQWENTMRALADIAASMHGDGTYEPPEPVRRVDLPKVDDENLAELDITQLTDLSNFNLSPTDRARVDEELKVRFHSLISELDSASLVKLQDKLSGRAKRLKDAMTQLMKKIQRAPEEEETQLDTHADRRVPVLRSILGRADLRFEAQRTKLGDYGRQIKGETGSRPRAEDARRTTATPARRYEIFTQIDYLIYKKGTSATGWEKGEGERPGFRIKKLVADYPPPFRKKFSEWKEDPKRSLRSEAKAKRIDQKDAGFKIRKFGVQ